MKFFASALVLLAATQSFASITCLNPTFDSSKPAPQFIQYDIEAYTPSQSVATVGYYNLPADGSTQMRGTYFFSSVEEKNGVTTISQAEGASRVQPNYNKKIEIIGSGASAKVKVTASDDTTVDFSGCKETAN